MLKWRQALLMPSLQGPRDKETETNLNAEGKSPLMLILYVSGLWSE